jgi:hypothetical protein
MFATASGLALGTVSAVIGIAGFLYGRTGSVSPDISAVPFLTIVITVIALTTIVSLSAARSSLAAPLVQAAETVRG